MALNSDVLAWSIGIFVVVAASLFLWMQRRQQQRLQQELDSIESMGKRNVEYDMVLKTMRLATWKINVASQEVTFDSDYREFPDYLTSEVMTMRDFAKRIAPEDRDRIHLAILDLMEGRRDEYSDSYRVRPFGIDHYIWEESFCMVSERNEAGDPAVIVGTSMSIEGQKKIEAELIEARNKAEESDRLKSAFLANMSHEIRTPLNAIVGFSDILPMVEEKEERDHLVALIQENNHKLLRMINDIVNISKMEAGARPAKMEDFNLNMLLKEKAETYKLQNNNPDIEIRLEVNETAPLLHSDRERVGEILDQYMLNALKFTAKGSVTLGYNQQPGGGTRVWVRDTGRGVPADKCSQIFEHFVKLDDFVPGTGLGLPISRLTARSIQAQVGVDSQEGIGSTFWVEIPDGN